MSGPHGNLKCDFGMLYAKTNNDLNRFAAFLGLAPQDRDDVTQQAFLRLIESNQSLTLDHARRYLFRSVKNLVIDQSRRKKVRKIVPQELRPNDITTTLWHDNKLHKQRLESLIAALDQLADSRSADVLVWFYRDGLSVEDIRVRLNCKVSTVTAKLCRQRRRHLKILQDVVSEESFSE
jgi:RNA polymerase sigma factor (sigma-70 family)